MRFCRPLVGPGEEHTTLAGLPTEASIWNAVEAAIPGFLQNVYAHTAGGGKFLGILQVKKRQPADEGRQGQAALLALATYSELKILFWLMKMSTSLTATISCGR